MDNVDQTELASPVGQDVTDGFIAKANEKTAQLFISQQIFRIPDTEKGGWGLDFIPDLQSN